MRILFWRKKEEVQKPEPQGQLVSYQAVKAHEEIALKRILVLGLRFFCAAKVQGFSLEQLVRMYAQEDHAVENNFMLNQHFSHLMSELIRAFNDYYVPPDILPASPDKNTVPLWAVLVCEEKLYHEAFVCGMQLGHAGDVIGNIAEVQSAIERGNEWQLQGMMLVAAELVCLTRTRHDILIRRGLTIG